MKKTKTGKNAGTALVTVMVLTAMVAILAGAALTYTASSVEEVEYERAQIQALYAAEAGLNAGLAQISLAHKSGDEVPARVGSDEVPVGPYTGQYVTTLTMNPDETLTIRSTGSSAGSNRTIESIAKPLALSPFDTAMFAANFSDDTDYTLTLGGTGGQADFVTGDMYVGGDLVVEDDALVAGDVKASGTVTGTPGESDVSLELPMILTLDYERFHDHNVAAAFDGAPRLDDDAGGTAGQLPVEDPSHIFRKDPTDRAADTMLTQKDDYFLEDPYEAVRQDLAQDGSDAFEVSLPADANNTVYFIDGNLWLHSRMTMSLKIKNEGLDPTQVTFVVKGNVYFSDNFFYDDPMLGGVAFIALSDPDVEDSGNIYFGDPSFGTMHYAEAMMFAENNFYDNNLDAAGSSTVEIRGSMTAGNQIDIQRDYEQADGSIAHTKLKLTFDDRQREGALNLPGIPRDSDHPVGYTLATWREVAVPVDFDPPQPTILIEADPGPPGGGDDWRDRWNEQFEDWSNGQRDGMWGGKHGKGTGWGGGHGGGGGGGGGGLAGDAGDPGDGGR